MRRSILVAIPALLAAALVIAACSTDAPTAAPAASGDASPDGAPAGDSATSAVDGSANDGATRDADAALPYPVAKGDPCRGIPLPADQHFVPPGMCARLVAANIGDLRQFSFAPDGVIFAATRTGYIYRLRDANDDGFFQPSEIVKYAETDGNTNNVHIDVTAGYIYAGRSDGVQRWPYGPTAVSGGDPETVVTLQPYAGHYHRTVRVYDGYLYVSSGSLSNANDAKGGVYDDDRSLIRRFKLSSFVAGTPFVWSAGEVVTVGLRNANGFTRNAAGRMYAVVNGIDNVDYDGDDIWQDNPGEQVVEIGMGKKYGFPFCFTAQRVVPQGGTLVAPGTQLRLRSGVHDDAWCKANSMVPATFIQAHTAPLDMTFFDAHPQGALPERYRGGAFVALHGSWARTTPTGYKVIWIPFDAAGKTPMPVSTATTTTFPYETVFGGGSASGEVDGSWGWAAQGFGESPRFAGVAVSPVDGALYASTDEGGGYLYRVGIAPKK